MRKPASGSPRSALGWAFASWLRPADRPANWEQRAGRRLGLGEYDIGPQNPPSINSGKSPAEQSSHATPQGH